MSTLYMFDAHANPVANAKLTEARYNATECHGTGFFVVPVSETMALTSEPTSLSSCLAAKYAAMLAYYATYASIAYEDFTAAPGVNYGSSSNLVVGQRGCTKLLPTPSAGVYRSSTVALGGTPSTAVVLWDLHLMSDQNTPTAPMERIWQTRPASDATFEVSFNNGATWIVATSGGLMNISGPDQGSNLVVRITNTQPTPCWLSSWAVLY